MASYTPPLTSLDKRQETQDLPFWLSASYTTLANPTNPYGAPITTVAIVNLPLTYYGPSIPLGSGWVWGGDASPASIYIPPSVTETGEVPTTTPRPTSISAAISTSASASPSPTSGTLATQTGISNSATQSTVSSTQSIVSSTLTSPITTASGTSSISSLSASTESPSASLPTSETPSSIIPTSSASVSPATFPPTGKHLALPTGAIVGIAVGGILAIVICCILAACCLGRRRDHRSSYRRSDPRDPEVQAGVAEQSSLLSGRLAGGESPPVGSPTMGGVILRSGRRTPLSTRRPQYETVPTALGTSETAEVPEEAEETEEAGEPVEPSRASTDEVHRRSANGHGYAALATGAAVGAAAAAATTRSRSAAPPEIRTSNLQTSSSGSTSPRSRIGSAIAGSFLNLFGGRRSRRQEQLGEGWEEVVPPTRQQAMGLGMTRPPTPPRLTDSPLQPFPPNSLGSSSRPSEMVLNSTYTTHERPPSLVSGQTEYLDARSRPQTPGSGLAAGAVGVALGEPEMSERNVSLVSRRSEPPVPPLPLQGHQPVSAVPPHVRSSLHTSSSSGNPFENSAYLADQHAYDDALDSLPPVGLLPAGVASGDHRARWTRSAIEEEDETSAALLGGALDDEPPAPARSFSRSTGEQISATPPIDRSAVYTPSLHHSGLDSPRMGQEERDITAESFDESGGRPWSGQVVRAESISLGRRVPSTRPVWTQSLATHTTGPSPIATTSQQPFPPPLMPPPPAAAGARASRASRDWTTQLDTPGSDYRAMVAWFEQNPTPGGAQRGSLVVPPNEQEQEPSDESSSLGRARSDAEQDRRRLSVPREADIQPPRPYSS